MYNCRNSTRGKTPARTQRGKQEVNLTSHFPWHAAAQANTLDKSENMSSDRMLSLLVEPRNRGPFTALRKKWAGLPVLGSGSSPFAFSQTFAKCLLCSRYPVDVWDPEIRHNFFLLRGPSVEGEAGKENHLNSRQNKPRDRDHCYRPTMPQPWHQWSASSRLGPQHLACTTFLIPSRTYEEATSISSTVQVGKPRLRKHKQVAQHLKANCGGPRVQP